MRNIRVYVDTSVFGGTEDEEFSVPSRQFFERVHRGEFEVLVSQITVDELAGAPATVQRVLEEIPDESLILVSANQEWPRWQRRTLTLVSWALPVWPMPFTCHRHCRRSRFDLELELSAYRQLRPYPPVPWRQCAERVSADRDS